MHLIVFDVDDTLTTNNSWERLNAAAGVTSEEDYALYNGFTQHHFDYDAWINQLATLYRERGILTSEIAKSALLNFKLRDGVIDVIKICKDKGHRIMLLSGGFAIMAKTVGELVGADIVFATTDIAFDSTNHFEQFLSGGEEGVVKVNILKAYCEKEDIKLTDCIAIGDSMNDVPLFKLTGNGVTFSWCKPEAQSAARHVINDIRDFPALLDIL